MDESLVLYEKDGPVAVVTLNRPSALNAVNLAMRDELWGLLLAVRDDPDVRAVLMRGAGERAFCAGADVKEFGTAPSLDAARRARRERDLWGELVALPKPVMVAMHGWCLGAGLEMSLYCDLRIAADDARLGLPETTLGYIPSAGGTQTLPRIVPRGDALRMILSGQPVPATEARRLGLVHRVVARAELDAEARTAAHRLAALTPSYAAAAKAAVRDGLDLPLSLAIEREAVLTSTLLVASGQ